MSQDEMGCDEVQPLLEDEALGEPLTQAASAAVRKHVAACAECARRAAELKATVELLSAAPAISPSERFDDALFDRLEEVRGGERSRRFVVFAALACVVHRVRKYQLAAAVYPLVLMCMGYVIWAAAMRGPDGARRDYYTGPEGALALRRPAEWPTRPSDVPAELELAIPKEEPLIVRDDPFGRVAEPWWPAEPGPSLPAVLAAVEWPAPALEAPRTPEELARLPEPPVAAVRVLPAGGPGGAELARARFATIKNADPRLKLAVSGGLVWLCRNQNEAGFWSAGQASEYSDAEITAAAALAFMESGFTSSGNGETSRSLRAALRWLIRQKRADGTFAPLGPRQVHAQAMVCTALSEALRTSDRELFRRPFRPIIQNGVAALIANQSASGAWGSDDPELTAVVVVAAGAARAAGLTVDAAPHKSALAWLDTYRKSFPQEVHASVPPSAGASKSITYATIGTVLGAPESVWSTAEGVDQAAAELAGYPVIWESGDFFRWYAGTLAAYRLDGPSWQKWRSNLLVQLVPRQEGAVRGKAAAEADRGSWPAHGICREGGRPYATAMAVLSLTASFGHSPVYGSAK